MKSKLKKITYLFISLLMALLLNNTLISNNGAQTELSIPKQSAGYSESFIHVDGNWSDTAVDYDWCSGAGSWANPYIIENVTVDCGGTGSGILIENSKNEYFIIKNCTVYNAGGVGDAGIKLENTCNGTIITNNCSNNLNYGMYFDESDNNTISGNTANNNTSGGMYLYSESRNNTVSGNTANNNGENGIYLDDHCRYNTITGNTVNNNTDNGIELYSDCDNNTISGNTANNNTDNGIYLWNYSDNNTISGNIVNDNDGEGIHLEYSNNNTLSGNTANYNHEGIYLFNSDNNTISGNIANENDHGLELYESSDYNTISGNTANDNNEKGIWIDSAYNNIISGNIANGNDHSGIYLEGSHENTVSGNTANDNRIFLDKSDYNNITGNTVNDHTGDPGIYLYDSDHNTVSGNTANNNSQGISLGGCDNNTISGNTVNYNNFGIILGGCDNNTISGNTANNNGHGIYLESNCNNNAISGNTANNNGHGIRLLTGCNNNKITENTINNSSYGISLEGCDNNIIYGNFFLKNGFHAFDWGTDNKWNSTNIGNYWDNWISPDVSPNDGIVDLPYDISGSAGSKDYLPIAEDGAPSITINSPTSSDVFGVYAPSFDLTITDDYLDSMWYTIDGGINNYTFIENGIINQFAWDTMKEGSITLTFYASDIPGNTMSADVIITKDFEVPVVQITSPTQGSVFGVSAPSFTIRITDDYLDYMWYTLDGGLHNYTFAVNGSIDQSAWNAISDGAVILKFYANDTLDHVGSAEVSVVKDITDPIIIINSPVDGEEFGTQAPLFNITVTDNNLDVMWYSFDGGSTNYAITANATISQTAWTALPEGDVTITFYARDLAGNEASEAVTVEMIIPAGGLDPGIIITIVVVSIAGGVAVAAVIFIYLKKRASPK